MSRGPPGLERWFDIDPYLVFYRNQIIERFLRFNTFRKKLSPNKDLSYVTKAYQYFGIHVDRSSGVVTVREWAPGAKALFFAGDFNFWNRESHPFNKLEDDVWELVLQPKADGRCMLRHMSEVKIVIQKWDETKHDRLSPWATYVEQPLLPSDTQFRQKLWCPAPDKIYQFIFPKPSRPRSLKIYECHIGIATGGIDKGIEIGTYKKFSREILPRIKANGYNAVQIMAIMEHAYYASFGYQVTSFYAVSSRYGTPEDFKELVDKAHSMNLYVILDLVHSHASSNVDDGLNEFDGTKGCFFYDDARGYHTLWGSRIFNTNNITVLRFLISNACWYMDEYNIDGFRFDGITAMLYRSRGINQSFTGHYDEYFGDLVDPNGSLYCQLINYFLHKVYPNMITIAEEVSGMPGICRPCYEGGLGFDYRLAMSIPDKWIAMLKTKRDEDWNLGDLIWTHTNRRHRERNVAYCESHDQALVGDKTISFWLMDAKMYWEMKRKRVLNIVIDRGLALHKMIRLFTHALGGEAYMNFIGNEFGHPEWLDFPRKGNAWSYHYCRRQWKLVDDKALLYTNLNAFDRAMNIAEEKYGWLPSREAYVSLKHEADKIVVFERADLVFVFNFHVTQSFSNYRIGVDHLGEYQCILCTDDKVFAGHDRVDASIHHVAEEHPYCNRRYSMMVYIPNRAAIVLARSDEVLIREQDYNENIVKTVAEITMYARTTISTLSTQSTCQTDEYFFLDTKETSATSIATTSANSFHDINMLYGRRSSGDHITASPEGTVPFVDERARNRRAIIMNITDSGTVLNIPGPHATGHSLERLSEEEFEKQPPMGEMVGGGETPLTSSYDVRLEMNVSHSCSESPSDTSMTIVDTSMELLDPIEELTESMEEGGSSSADSTSLVQSLEGQVGSGSTVSGGMHPRSCVSLIGSSSGSGRSVTDNPSDVTVFESDPSSSNYETASSSHYDTAGSLSDLLFDMSLWGMSSTSTLSSEELRTAIQNLPAEKLEEFQDTFEELPDDDE